MFGFIKRMFIAALRSIWLNVTNAIPLKCVSMSNHECKLQSTIVDKNVYFILLAL